jgi:Zn-dependent peptidase ImmA (M78 family)
MTIRRKLIRTKVNALLQGLNPRTREVPVEQLVESVGLRIERKNIDDRLAGFLVRGKGIIQPIVGVNSRQLIERQRFTLAHELAHYLLHNVEGVHVDQEFNVKLRSGLSSQGTDVDEMEANLFAAELLMPQAWLEEDINNLDPFDVESGPEGDDVDVVQHLAKRYKVSRQAMGIRLSSLGYLSI